MSDHLSLEDLERFDSQAPSGGKERRFCCPLCGQGKAVDRAHRSLAVNTQTGLWICHRCQANGKLKDYWENRHREYVPKRERARADAARLFALRSRLVIEKPAPAPEDLEKETRWRGWWRAARELPGTSGAAYLSGRSIPVDIARSCGVRYSSEWFDRPAVLFPVGDRAGELVAVSGRFTDGRTDPKTQTAGPKSQGVFALPGALDAACVAIVEGPIDALALAVMGIPAIALIGVSWPEWLPSACAFKSVLIATDRDTAGDEAAMKLAPVLAARGAHTLRIIPQAGKDWGEWLEQVSPDSESARLLAGFSAGVDDDYRVWVASELAKRGQLTAALFLVRLLDIDLRGSVERYIRSTVMAASGMNAVA